MPNGDPLDLTKYEDVQSLISATVERARQEQRVATMLEEIKTSLNALDKATIELLSAVRDIGASVQTLTAYLGALSAADSDRLTHLLERATRAAGRAVTITSVGQSEDVVGRNKNG